MPSFTSRLLVVACVMMVVNAYLETPQNDDRNECGLAGVWENQVESAFEIEWCSQGHVSGRYKSAVGNAISYYDLSGKYSLGESVANTTIALAWTVGFNNVANGNSESVTAWSGVYFKVEEKIYAHWILSYGVARDSYWKSKYVGDATFTRVVGGPEDDSDPGSSLFLQATASLGISMMLYALFYFI